MFKRGRFNAFVDDDLTGRGQEAVLGFNSIPHKISTLYMPETGANFSLQ